MVVVGSYANDSNAQQAQTKVANYLRQSGIAAQTQIIESAGRLRVAVLASGTTQPKVVAAFTPRTVQRCMAIKDQADRHVSHAVAVKPVEMPQAPTMARKQEPNRATATPVQARAKKTSLRKPKPLAQPMEFDARVKGFALAADLPGNDWQRQSFANPTTDFSGDLRLMLNKTVGHCSFNCITVACSKQGTPCSGAKARRTSRPDDRDGCSSTVGYDLANRLGA